MDKKNILLGIISLSVIILSGLLILGINQSNKRSFNVYQKALNDYENGNYQNSYYQFSKVSFISKLKPFAIYRQAMCAKELGDKKAQLKQYQLLSNNYTKNILSVRSKYAAAQLLVKDNPKVAYKYFQQIIKRYPNTDYAIASEYYSGLLLLKKYENNSKLKFSLSEKNKIEKKFRYYLTKTPSGNQALDVVSVWLRLDKDISPDDYLLMANTYYLFEDYANAKKLIAYTNSNDGRILDIKILYKLKNYTRAKSMIVNILNTEKISSEDMKELVDLYMKMSVSKTDALDFLYQIANQKDYVLNLKCENAPVISRKSCYSQLYINYPDSIYAPNALAQMFFYGIDLKNYEKSKKIGFEFLDKYPKSTATPFVLFWLGKVEEYNKHYDISGKYYRHVIHDYPDNYYAYRSYVALTSFQKMPSKFVIKNIPVVYPYKNISPNSVVFDLVRLKDYEILDLISDDVFVKSWILYNKGDYSRSMLLARDAMENMNPKPPKTDLRWRLVYPVNYYEKIKQYSLNNNSVLIMALMREESYFNKDATSSVGAKGLMQLMPATAYEIAGYNFDLYNADLNIKVGNVYYSKLRQSLGNLDVSAIAAYNGGINSINKWKTDLDYSNTDEFVEQIPYSETKTYVKKVFRTYWNYLRIYGVN